MPLPSEHLLDELATAYVHAVVSAAGATIAISRLDYGVDGTLKHILEDERGRFIESGYPVDFQLKGTTSANFGSDLVTYDLRARNFDLISNRTAHATPYYLFLVCFPDGGTELVLEDDRLILNASAFWWTRSGNPAENTSSVRIRIPKSNRLTADAITQMLSLSEARFYYD